jgi:CBS domain containing-hemolysin-like protein
MTPPAWLLVAAAVLALVAGWCARAEAALTLVAATGAAERPDRSDRQDRPDQKRPDQKRPDQKRPDEQTTLRTVAADLPRYLSVLLLLRAICEVFAAVLVTAAFVRWFGDDWRAVFSALAVAIVLHYALTGVRPQASAIGPRVERTAGRAAAFLYPLTRALGPLPRLLVAVGNVLPPGRRVAPRAHEGQEARSELRGLVDYLGRRTGIEPGEREMVRSVFELGDTIVREVMVPRTDMVFIENDRTVEQALSLALRSGFSRIPVVGENEDDVVGIAYLKDIVAWSHEHPGAESTEKVATVIRPASYVPDSKPVDELLRQMQAQRNHVAIVIDEYGGTAGLVTIEDILEEIVGEITDEYDHEQPPVEWLPDGSARVTARLSVTELEELFDVRVDDEDVETVAGLLAHQLGRVPIAGSTATVRGLRLTAENLAGRRNKIGTVLVERDEEADS